MKNLLKNIIPQTGLFTMAVILISAIYNIIENAPSKPFYLTLLAIMGGAFLLNCVEYYLLHSVWQRSAKAGLIFSCLIWYIGVASLLFFSGWISFSVPNLIAFTVDFLIVYFLITWYNIYRLRMDAEEINRYLDKRNANSK